MVNDDNINSAILKADTRVSKFFDKQDDEKNNDDGSEEFKRQFIRSVIESPQLLSLIMKAEPERMKRLIEKYGKDLNFDTTINSISNGV